jgi:NADPH2:quinone reductase
MSQATHTALVCQRLSNDLSGLAFEQRERQPLGPGEVRLQVLAAAIGFPDLLMTRGGYQHKPALPFVPGMECCARVLETGPGVDAWIQPGLRVIGSAKEGALSQERVLPARTLRPVPEGLDDAHAAAMSSQGITAYVSLVCRGQLARGETLLVHGAGGGVGVAAVRLGVHLGARVIATASSPAKIAVARAHGAHETIDLSQVGIGGLRDRVRELTADRGVDVVYDPVGGDLFDASVRCLAWGGRLLVVGFADGRIPTIAANQILIRGISVLGVRAGEYGRRFPALGADNQVQVDRLAAQGVLVPHVGHQLDLADALAGFQLLARREAIGRVVIRMTP